MSGAVGALRAAWLLSGLRLRRQFNQIRSRYRFRKGSTAKNATTRTGTGGKLGSGMLTAFVVLAMVANFVNISYRGMTNMQAELGSLRMYNDACLGIVGVEIGPATVSAGIRQERGVHIGDVAANGPARAAGLQTGDAIVAFDGKTVSDLADLMAAVSATPPGRRVEVTTVRNGDEEQKMLSLGAVPAGHAQISTFPVTPAPGTLLPVGVIKGGILESTLLLLAALFVTLASREITQPEWDLEWLVTLPLPLSTLIASRLVERAATNSTGFVVLGPFLSVFAWACGYRWSAPFLALGLTFALLFVVSVAQTLVDTGLRLTLPPPKLRNLQALVSIVSGLSLLLAMLMALRQDNFLFGWAARLPDWVNWLPTGLALRALAAAGGGAVALYSALLVGEIALIFVAGFALLHRQLRNGVVAAGAREAVRGPRVTRRNSNATATGALISTVQRRELRLLGRDRSFMVQTLVLPPLMVGAQVFINARSNIFAGAVDNPQNLAAIAFGLAAYTLMLSAFQTLNAEGQALWILYTVPQSLEFILWQKARLWASAVIIYPLLIFVAAFALAGTISPQFLGAAAIVLAGVPIFAMIATALGVFACNPLAQEVQRRIRPTYVYLFMTLASLYIYAIYASTSWQSIGTIVLSALLALALWQKARDRFDYLLDPTAAPPACVSVADGMMAALIFFVLQAAVAVIFKLSGSGASNATVLWVAFCAAGALTYAIMRLVYWRTHATGIPRLFGSGLRQALLWGLAGGLFAALAGVAYIQVIAALDLYPAAGPARLASDRTLAITLAVLAVFAAPLFEEFIFRGLIFGGLRRSLGLGVATLASAAIFAVVHPPLSVVPVFVMGCCAALVYDRTKVLAAPMLVHAIYNAAVIGFQWNVMQ